MQSSKLSQLPRGKTSCYYTDVTRLSESQSNKLGSVKVDRTEQKIELDLFFFFFFNFPLPASM